MKLIIKSTVLLLLLAFTDSTFSQSIKISGKVLSDKEEIIAGASVMLIGAQDSILKTYSITNKEGIFNLNYVKTGNYLLKASFFGYLPYEKPITVKENSGNIELGSITLKPKMLDEVVVEGHYVPIQIKGDTIEYDSRAFEVKEHEVVEDLLKQLPGVEVEEDGTVKVQGEEVEQVLVDGEKFFGEDATIATKNLPANSVSKVQVFDKKSDMSEFTGVDDGSESPTINLKLKDSHKKGYFGNIELAGGTELPISNTLRYKSKGNIHYFKDKWQLSVIGMSNNINETGFTFSDYANFMGGIQNMMRSGGMSFNTGGLNVNGGGADDGFLNTHASGFNFNYSPSKNTTLSSSIFLNSFDKNYDKTLERETYFTDSTILTNEVVGQNSNTLNNRGNIHFEQKFDSTHFLNIDLSGSWNNTDYLNNNFTLNSSRSGQPASDFNTTLNQNDTQYDYSLRADYRKKFKKAGRYTGGGFNFELTNSDAATRLDYLNRIYTSTNPIDILTNQDQFLLQKTNTIEGNWEWSEPLTKNQLLQLNLDYGRDVETRNKEVFDIQADNKILNDFLSANGDYYKQQLNAGLNHKFIKKQIRTTVGAKYQNLNLSGDQIFSEAKTFNYILPNITFDWDVNKKSSIGMSYKTSTTAPTLNQLQPLPDNTNPSEIILGNTNLSPEYNHNFRLNYRTYNQYNFTFFMASISGSYVQNNITYSQTLNQFYVKEITPENLGDERSINSFIVYGTSVHALKTKFRVSTSGSISNGIVNLNGLQDQYTTYTVTPDISIENIGKKVIDLRTGISYNYSLNQYKDNENFNNDFQNWNYYADATLKLKDRWVINAKAKHFFYPDFDNNNELLLVDFSIGLNLLESRKLQVNLSGKDLLNQNTGISQYYLQNIYEQETTQTLGRYALIGIKYSFQNMGKQ